VSVRIGLMLRPLDEKGGIGVYTRYLTETLLKVDDRNEYVLFYRDPANLGRFADPPRVTERVVAARNKALWDQVAIPRACRGERLDVLFHPKFTVPLFSPVPPIMVLHGADWFLPEAARFYGRLDRIYIRAFMPLYLRRAAVVLSVSRLTTQHFERIFRTPPGKIRTVYFGPAPHFRRVTDAAVLDAVRARYGLPERYILTLSKAAGGERKNVGGTLRAYARLHGAVPHALVVGGQGCERFRGDYGIPDAGWGAGVVFPGWIDQQDLPAVYSMSELFLYPSNQEAFPIPITEAMACGTPIVTSDANGLEEIAGDAALRVDPSDDAAIADAALRVLADPALSARLAAAGLARAATFSWDACARQTLAILEETASAAAGHRVPPATAGRP
jgi:glycosyltransferase involved in cell wall biosynthesis